MKEKYKYLGKNTLIFGISSFGTKFLSFLLVPLYTNILSTEEYGTADLITTTATLLIFVLTINIADAVLRYSIGGKEKQEKILSYGIRVFIIGSLLCALGLGIVYLTRLLNWPWYYYLFIFLFFVFTALYQILSSYLRGIDKITQVAIAGIIASIGIIGGNILLLLVFKMGIVGYLISLVLGPGLASVYCFGVIGEPFSTYIINSCDAITRQEMRNYCIPLIFNNVALWINAFLDRYFVTAYCGVGENGIYSVASKIPIILATCYTVFSQAWNLSAIKEFDPEDKDGFFSKTYAAYNALIVVVCGVLIILNIPLAKFLYKKEFFEAWQYSSILLISVMFNSLTIIVGSVFTAAKDTKVIATTTIISAIANTVLNILLIPLMGAIGAGIATATAYFVMWIVRIYYSQKYIKFKINLLKDCIAYLIIIIQVVFEHIKGHMYCAQAVCIALIFLVYRNMLYELYKRIKFKINKW